MTAPVLTFDQTRVRLHTEMEAAFNALEQFAMTPQFLSLLGQMWRLSPSERHDFVDLIWMNPDQLKRACIVCPEGVSIQRSWFEDNRPTLFCLVKSLPPDLIWKKVTITFDNEDNGTNFVRWLPPAEFIESVERSRAARGAAQLCA